MDSTRLLKKSGLYFIGNFSSKILTALLLPLYAFYISTEDFGYFDYSQTLMNIIMPFIFVAIWESILKFIIAENDDKTKDKILGTSAIFTLTIGIVSIFIICIAVSIMQVKIDYLNYITAMILAHSFAQIWQYYALLSLLSFSSINAFDFYQISSFPSVPSARRDDMRFPSDAAPSHSTEKLPSG